MGYLKFRKSILNKLLLKACKKNRLGLVKCIIFWGANKDIKFEDQSLTQEGIFYRDKTLIQISYESNAFKVAKYLINNSSNISNEELQRACAFGSLEIVKCLVEKIDKTYIDRIGESGYTPFMFACFLNRGDIAKYLLEVNDKIVDINKVSEGEKDNALMLACKNSNLELVKCLLQKGAKLTQRVNGEKVIIKDLLGCTPLMYLFKASQYKVYKNGDIEKIIDCLLKEEESLLNEKDKLGKSVLMYAVDYGNLDVVKYLVAKGVIINETDYKGNNVLFYAIKNKSFDILQYLVDKSVSLNDINKMGKNLLICAIEEKNINMVKCLVERGALINKTDGCSKSALMCAIETKDEDIVRYLVKNGADIYEKYNSKTLLMYAIEQESREIAQILLEEHLNKGSEKDTGYLTYKDKSQDDVLIYALRKKDEKLVDLLIDSNECDIKAGKYKNKLIDDYGDIIDLFDYLKDKGIILNKVKILDLVYNKVNWGELFSGSIKLKDDNLEIIKDVYQVIKKININRRKLINNGEEKFLFKKNQDDIKLHYEADNLMKQNISRKITSMKGFWRTLKTYITQIFNRVKYFLKFPYVKYKKLINKLLISACSKNRRFLANMALFFGADINMKYEEYNKIVKVICENKNLEMLNFLMDKGLDLKREDALKKTVIHYAIDSGDVEIVRRVINRVGADYIANETDEYGKTYLMHAASGVNVEIVKEIIKCGSSIKREDAWHSTVFGYAHNNKDILKCLLESSENINIRNSVGENVLEEIISYTNLDSDIIKMIIEKGGYVSKDNMMLTLDGMFEEKLDKVRAELNKDESNDEQSLNRNADDSIRRENIGEKTESGEKKFSI